MHALPALVTRESSAIHKAIDKTITGRALKAVGQADLSQSLLTLRLRSVKLQKLGHRESFLELNDIESRNLGGISVQLFGLTGPVVELAA